MKTKYLLLISISFTSDPFTYPVAERLDFLVRSNLRAPAVVRRVVERGAAVHVAVGVVHGVAQRVVHAAVRGVAVEVRGRRVHLGKTKVASTVGLLRRFKLYRNIS